MKTYMVIFLAFFFCETAISFIYTFSYVFKKKKLNEYFQKFKSNFKLFQLRAKISFLKSNEPKIKGKKL